MNHYRLILLISLCIGISAFLQLRPQWQDRTPVAEVLDHLGQPRPIHYLATWDTEKAAIGKTLFQQGFANVDGKNTKRISKHYACVNCHNTVKEDPDLANPSPETRLLYAQEKQLPFLQGSTMYGVVNRTSWYNGDYEKKYGTLVVPARDTLANAIQLCAKECSQGRILESWELEAFIHYFWSIQLKLEDLNLNDAEWRLVQSRNEASKELILSKFKPQSDAHFVNAVKPTERSYGKTGNAENGKVIYQQSCLSCHHPSKRITNLKLEDNKLSHQLLKAALKKTSEHSVYEIVRIGTSPIAGYKPYMPHYTQERLSNTQIEDLVAYITSQCN